MSLIHSLWTPTYQNQIKVKVKHHLKDHKNKDFPFDMSDDNKNMSDIIVFLCYSYILMTIAEFLKLNIIGKIFLKNEMK